MKRLLLVLICSLFALTACEIEETATPSPEPTSRNATRTPRPTNASSNSPSRTPQPTESESENRSVATVPANDADDVESSSETRYISTGAANVNVRAEPSTNADIVGSLSNGSEITITGSTDDWYRIDYDGEDAWVFASLTSTTQPNTSAGSGSSGGSSSGGNSSTANPTAPPAAVCDCSGNIYNCSDFSTHNQAQVCHDYCESLGRGDIHGLDGSDDDGLACESLP